MYLKFSSIFYDTHTHTHTTIAVSRQRKWFMVEEALLLLRRKPIKHRYFKEACSLIPDRNTDTNKGSCVNMQNEETRNLKERHYFLDCQS